MTYQLDFTADPDEFLAATGLYLGADPVVNTVVATIAMRNAADRRAGIPVPHEAWYLTVSDRDGDVVGVGMRTAPFEPHPIYLLPMPDRAATDLASVLIDRGEVTSAINGAVNGAMAPATAYAEEVVRRLGGNVHVAMHTRLFELTSVIDPQPVPGRLRSAEVEEAERVRGWMDAFHVDADEQAGRSGEATEGDSPTIDMVVRRIESDRVWLWEDGSGTPVHLTGCSHASFGAQRIGPVYTPAEHRGHGYASAAVAEISRRILTAGARPCLFTDQANPTSNKIYQGVGFVPVVDMVQVRVD